MPEALKEMYNLKFIRELSDQIINIYPSFNQTKFKKNVFDKEWKKRELKERMRHITVCLQENLPTNYSKSLAILKKVSKSMKSVSFELMIFPDFVEIFGQDHWDESMQAIEVFTQSSSGEFAVRPFIIAEPKRMMQKMLAWSKHKNYHVRRLATEGCRPRLPWAMALPVFKNNPDPVLKVLENLKTDSELYVRRSVANNLNDISKDHPAKVIQVLTRWNKDQSAEMKWLIKHSLRTLEKQGHPRALKLLGYSTQIKVKVNKLKLMKKKVKMGEKLCFDLELSSSSVKDQALLVDYIIYHMKANGKLSPKVFKLCKKSISKKNPLIISKRHHIKEISTRKYHAGKHEVHIQVNGKIVAMEKFYLQI